MCKVSVIMPSLNVAAYIGKSLKSVMGQTLQDLEILCIDAGSADGTLEIIETLARKDSRIKVIRSDRKSYGYQVNLGMERAQGEYIGIVETDDYIDSGMYETLYESAASAGFPDLVKCGYKAYWTARDGKTVFKERRLSEDPAFYGKTVKPADVPFLATEDWYLWSGIYKKSVVDRKGIRLSESPGAAFQDIGFLHRTNAAAESAVYLDDCLYNYCIDREGSSSNSGRELGYSYYEFHALMQEGWDERAERSLYIRMAKSFVCFCRTFDEKRIADAAFGEQYGWFVDRLREAAAKGQSGTDSLPPGIRKRLQVLLNNPDEVYKQYLHDHRHMLGGTGKFVIFGCGDRGLAAFRALCQRQCVVFAFMDNDARLWGSRLEGIPVLKPQVCVEEDVRYMIANEAHFDKIEEQLLGLGIKKEEIGIFW